jgi:hypothetical protein
MKRWKLFASIVNRPRIQDRRATQRWDGVRLSKHEKIGRTGNRYILWERLGYILKHIQASGVVQDGSGVL